MSRKHPLYNIPLPGGWELVTVDDLKAWEPHSCVAGPFGSSISSKYFMPEGVPVIRGSNLRDDLTPFVPKGFVYVSEEQAKKYKAQHVTAGDLVFTCWGTVGQVGLIPEDGPFREYIISNKQLKLRPDIKRAIPRFLFYYFAGPEMVKHILNRAIGAAVPGINLGILKSLEVALPPLPTQRKITAILSAYDDLIENNLRRIKILEAMAQNLYREWFVKFRFPGHQHARFIDSPLGQIPEGWEVANLLDIAVVKYGRNLPTKNLASDGDYPVYGAAKIIGRYTEYSREERTIITGCRGSVGEMQITLPKCFVTNNSFTFDVQQRIDFFWLFHSLKERGFADVIGGAAQPQITLDGLSKIQIIVPLKAARGLFHEHAEDMFSFLWNLEGRNTTLRHTRDLLLPRLISGDVDVSELDIAVTEEVAA